MTLYVDTADRQAAQALLETGLFAGLTTNPLLLSRAGLTQRDLPDVYAWARAAGARTVYMQTLGTDVATMLTSARDLLSIGPDIIVKIPATRAGFEATRELAQDGILVLVTAVYHPTQALLALAAGAHSIAPYVGRMTDQGRGGIDQTVAMAKILAGSSTGVLAASLRTPDDIASLAAQGVTDFTVSAAVLEQMLADDLTVAAAAEFESVARG